MNSWPNTVQKTCMYIRDLLLPELEKWLSEKLLDIDAVDECLKRAFCQMEARYRERNDQHGSEESVLCNDLNECIDSEPCDGPPEKPAWPFSSGDPDDWPPTEECPDGASEFCSNLSKLNWAKDYIKWISYELQKRLFSDKCLREALCSFEAQYGPIRENLEEPMTICQALDDCKNSLHRGQVTPKVMLPKSQCANLKDVLNDLTSFFESLIRLIQWFFDELDAMDQCLVSAGQSLDSGFLEFYKQCSKRINPPQSQPQWPWERSADS